VALKVDIVFNGITVRKPYKWMTYVLTKSI
jgi:hypothetical protein